MPEAELFSGKLCIVSAIQQSLMLMMITASFSGLETLLTNVFKGWTAKMVSSYK